MASIGEELRRARMRKGLTLLDVETVLHIRMAYLEAIEEGNFSIIPGHVYTKGFIRNYAEYVGLDGERMEMAYADHIGERPTFTTRALHTYKQSINPTTVREEMEEHTNNKERLSLRRRQREQSLARERFILMVILLAMAIFLVWLFLF